MLGLLYFMVVLRKFLNVSSVISPKLFLTCAALWGSRQFSVIFLCNVLLCETCSVVKIKQRATWLLKRKISWRIRLAVKANNKKQVGKQDGILR